MNAKELKNIDRLEFSETKREPAFDLGYRKHYRSDRSDGLDFQVGISGNGFEAMRNLNLAALIEIRDWIDEVVRAEKQREGA